MKYSGAIRLSINLLIIKNWGLGRSPKRGEGGSPTFSLSTDAERVCPRVLRPAKPTKRSYRGREFTLFL